MQRGPDEREIYTSAPHISFSPSPTAFSHSHHLSPHSSQSRRMLSRRRFWSSLYLSEPGDPCLSTPHQLNQKSKYSHFKVSPCLPERSRHQSARGPSAPNAWHNKLHRWCASCDHDNDNTGGNMVLWCLSSFHLLGSSPQPWLPRTPSEHPPQPSGLFC